MRFYLGTHHPHWLWAHRSMPPLFISARRLRDYRRLHRALTSWALDSGGFSELTMFGRWTISPEQYVAEVRRWIRQAGELWWAAPQDWMCEPPLLAKTGLAITEHQARTIESVVELRHLAPEILWIPVLQGWTVNDYHAHQLQYARAGIDLEQESIVGVGSICRRQSSTEVAELLRSLHANGLRLHAFGVKSQTLARLAPYLISADSMAWSFRARRSPPIPGHPHKNCANCHVFALQWRRKVLAQCARSSSLVVA